MKIILLGGSAWWLFADKFKADEKRINPSRLIRGEVLK